VPAKPRQRTFIVVALIGVVVVLAAVATAVYVIRRTPQPATSTQPTPGAPVAPAKPAIPEWGVEISADKTLEPAYPGGPSAGWEPVRVSREKKYPDAAIFHKDSLYVTVIGVPDSESAKNLVSKLRNKPPYESWKQAEVLQIRDWCPNPQFQQTLTVGEVSMPVYECDSGAGTK
jgi:hypothetical protein